MAWVTSTTSATCGSMPTALVRAPPPVPGDLLPRGGDREHRRVLGPVVGEEPQRFGHDVGADPVVDAAGHDAARSATRGLAASRTPASPTRTRASASRLVRGADVDPEVRDLRDLVPLVLLHEVDRLLADHAADRSAPAQRCTTRWPTSTCESQPPIPAKIEIPVVVDVGDLQRRSRRCGRPA